jgi:hypothetical protein
VRDTVTGLRRIRGRWYKEGEANKQGEKGKQGEEGEEGEMGEMVGQDWGGIGVGRGGGT